MPGSSIADINVSRETLEKLHGYESLLKKWNPAINLVAKSTIQFSWERHFVDSAQVFSLASNSTSLWLDIGSGGGFPGMVCAVIASEFSPSTRFRFIESDQRKATFLRSVARELELDVEVFSDRIEDVPFCNANVISARALAALPKLLELSTLHLAQNGTALFMKGASFRKEISEALESWAFSYEEYPSKTDKSAVILRIGDIERA